MAKVLLRNDYWCKGLGLTQPKSEAYGKYLELKKLRQRARDNGASIEQAREIHTLDEVLDSDEETAPAS